MATAGPAPLDEEDDDDDTGGDGVAVGGGAAVSLSRSALPAQVAGLPLVARPRLSAEDVQFLREYLGTRREKLAHSALRLSAFAAVAIVVLILCDGQFVVRIIGGTILAFGLIFGVLVMADWRRQRVLVEADLREGYLCRYEGVVPASDTDHMLVKGGLLRSDGGAVQCVEVLPVSRKLHRTNGALQWTWCHVE